MHCTNTFVFQIGSPMLHPSTTDTDFTFIPLTSFLQAQMPMYISDSMVREVTYPRSMSIHLAIHSREVSEFLTLFFNFCNSGIKMRISQSFLQTICRN